MGYWDGCCGPSLLGPGSHGRFLELSRNPAGAAQPGELKLRGILSMLVNISGRSLQPPPFCEPQQIDGTPAVFPGSLYETLLTMADTLLMPLIELFLLAAAVTAAGFRFEGGRRQFRGCLLFS